MKMCRGFTLLELMVTVAVVAILATVGVPSFRDLIQNNRVTTQTNELVTALNFARTEAVKRARAVEVVIDQTDSGWEADVRLSTDPTTILREVDRAGSGITVNQLTVEFAATGALMEPAVRHDLQMEPKAVSDDRYKRCVSIALSGQITTVREACPQ